MLALLFTEHCTLIAKNVQAFSRRNNAQNGISLDRTPYKWQNRESGERKQNALCAERRVKMAKRVFLIVLDSFGIGEMPDAARFGDEGSNTLGAIVKSPFFKADTMRKMGLFNIEDVVCGQRVEQPIGGFARLREVSNGKDTTTGHWELAGVESETALPVYPNGFPADVIAEFERRTGRGVLCNRPYSGTDVIRDYGEEHMKTGALIVYTSADSVFQVAAHEDVVPLPELYRYCGIAREMLTVGRVIARPFVGTCAADFRRTPNRHDLSLKPPRKTMLDAISACGLDTIGVGKIYDIFDGEGVTQQIKTKGNTEGIRVTLELAGRDFEGLAFINLVDFDMLYGHRNDVDGYARATAEFDAALERLLPMLRPDDLLLITADHGCDPSTPSTDHSREYVPLLAYGGGVRPGADLGTKRSFACVAQTVCEYLGVEAPLDGRSLLREFRN